MPDNELLPDETGVAGPFGARAHTMDEVIASRVKHGAAIPLLRARAESTWQRYVFPIAGVVIAAVLTKLAGGALDRSMYTLFWPVVIGAAWYGGAGPALMTSTLSLVAGHYATSSASQPFDWADILPFALFLLVSATVSYLVSAARVSWSHARDLAQKNSGYVERLRLQADDLRAQLEESQALSEELELSAEELEQLSEAAASAEQFSRSIVDSITDPFVVLDRDWHFQYINEAAASIFSRAGHPHMIGQSVWEAYPDLVGTPFEKNMRRAAETGEPVSFEAYYGGNNEWSVTHCYPLQGGGVAAQWRNITERKHSEEAAHFLSLATKALASSLDYDETLSRLAGLLVPQLGDWCAVHLVEGGRIRQVAVGHVDPAKIAYARELETRYPTPEDAPRGVPQVIRTGEPQLVSEVTDEMLRAGARDEEHLRISRELNIRSAVIVPLEGKDGVIGAITLIGAESGRRYTERDLPLVTEIGRRAALAVENARHHRDAVLEQERAARLQHEAEEANSAKTQFLTSMSHELRTPLNAIAGYADLMSLGIHGPLTEAQAEDVERIKRNQRHLLGIINDILNFARLDAGRVHYHIEDVSVRDVVDDLSPLVRPQLSGRSLHYEVDDIDAGLAVRADRERLRQVLVNLLSNAIKFTEPGGRIAVEVKASDDKVAMTVRDDGIGIPADKLRSIFEPFVQVDRSLARPVEGTGLGLAISRDMVDGMEGTLTVESSPGDGSAFTVTLPRGH